MSLIRLMLAASAASLVLAACGKSEPPASKPRPNAPAPEPKADSGTPAAPQGAEAAEALKERLARQEAASKLFDKAKPEPPPPAPAKPEPKAAEPARSAAAKPEPAKAAPAKAIEAPAPVAEKKAEPAPPPAPRTEVAAAKPAAAPPVAAPSTATKLVSRVDPDFPREALQAGAEKGNVKVRMTVDAAGNVVKVDIVEATPRRVFDRAVVRALSQWRFNEGAAGRTVETEVEFKR